MHTSNQYPFPHTIILIIIISPPNFFKIKLFPTPPVNHHIFSAFLIEFLDTTYSSNQAPINYTPSFSKIQPPLVLIFISKRPFMILTTPALIQSQSKRC